MTTTGAEPAPTRQVGQRPAPSPKYRRPEAGPSAADVRQRDAWNSLVSASLSTAQASAEKWRTGLGAFVSLVTAGLFIKGPESASDLSTGWRVVLTILLGRGLGLAMTGLWMALRAAAGNARETSLDQVVRTYGTVEAMQVALARQAAERIGSAPPSGRRRPHPARRQHHRLVVGARGAGIAARPPQGHHRGGVPLCGELLSGDGRTIVLRIAGQRDHVAVPYQQVLNIAVVASC